MTLREQTKSGLTFGQIITLLAFLGAIVTVWVSLNVQIARLEVRINHLEVTRLENTQDILRLYQENREDHKSIMIKLDRLIDTYYSDQ